MGFLGTNRTCLVPPFLQFLCWAMLPNILTPLGPLVFRAALGGTVVCLEELKPLPGTTFSCAEFKSTGAQGRFLIGTLDPKLLPEQRVDVCYGVHWRVEALEDMPALHLTQLSCTWGNPTSWTELGWSSGQTVEAYHWQDGPTDVCVGTIQPEGGLSYYGQLSYFSLPKRWFGTDPGRPSLPGVGVEISLAGLTVKYPALLRGEVCHTQFAVAWKTRRDDEDIDTWFAADLAPGQIVEAAYPGTELGTAPWETGAG